MNLRPSNMEAASVCPGRPVLEIGQPDRTSIYAKKGTILHRVLAGDYGEMHWESPELQAEYDQLGISISDEQAVANIREKCEEIAPLEQWQFEVPVKITNQDGFTLFARGTLDCLYIDAKKKIAYLVDAKFGRNPVTTSADNAQIVCYALGILQKHSKEVTKVKALIAQPLVGLCNDKWYTFTKPDIMLFNLQQIKERCMEAKGVYDSGDMETFTEKYLCPAKEACWYCRALSWCPAVKALQKFMTDVPGLPEDTDLWHDYYDKADIVIKACQRIKDDIKAKVLTHETAGRSITGLTIRTMSGGDFIKDLNYVYVNCFKPLGISVETFQNECCKLLTGNAKDLFARTMRDLEKAPSLKDAVDEWMQLTAPVRIAKNKKQQIERVPVLLLTDGGDDASSE